MQEEKAVDVTIFPHYIQGMRNQNFSARVDPEFLRSLDDLRKLEPDLPSKTEMLHRVVEQARKKALPTVAEKLTG